MNRFSFLLKLKFEMTNQREKKREMNCSQRGTCCALISIPKIYLSVESIQLKLNSKKNFRNHFNGLKQKRKSNT